MKRTDVNMLSGSTFKILLRISIPIMIMNVLQSLISIIDMAVLGIMVNDDAVGSVGTCGTLITLITGLVIGISAGSNVIIARCIGKGDKEGAQKAVGTSVLLSLVGGVALLILGVFFATPLLRLMNCPEELLKDAVLYFRLYFLGVPFIMLYNFSAAILRAKGESKIPMYYITLGGIAKILLNVFFIAVFKMAVDGVGIATIISWLMSGGLCFLAVCKDQGFVKFRLRHFRFYKEELLGILKIGLPAGIQSSLYSFANVIIAVTVNGFGPAATKGVSIANNYDGVLYNISIASSLAVMPFISQNVANGNVKRAKEGFYKAMLITVMLGASFGSLSAIFSGRLTSIISQDPEVIRYSCQKMVIISSTYFICGINEIFCASLRGLGKSVLPTVSTLIYLLGVRVLWVYLIFPLFPNLTFLYLVWPISWVLSILTLLAPLLINFKKLKKSATV